MAGNRFVRSIVKKHTASQQADSSVHNMRIVPVKNGFHDIDHVQISHFVFVGPHPAAAVTPRACTYKIIDHSVVSARR